MHYLAKLSFRSEREIKSSADKQNLKELITTKPALQKVSDKVLQAEKKEY